jgi:hypothetical protein
MVEAGMSMVGKQTECKRGAGIWSLPDDNNDSWRGPHHMQKVAV